MFKSADVEEEGAVTKGTIYRKVIRRGTAGISTRAIERVIHGIIAMQLKRRNKEL